LRTGGLPATLEADSRFLLISVYEYTPFCNGADEVKSPSDCLAAGLTLLSLVDAEAAS
jgi:hypothetical protein